MDSHSFIYSFIQFGLCGLFYVCHFAWASPHLFNQTLILVLLWMHFVDVIKVPNELTVIKEDCPR